MDSKTQAIFRLENVLYTTLANMATGSGYKEVIEFLSAAKCIAYTYSYDDRDYRVVKEFGIVYEDLLEYKNPDGIMKVQLVETGTGRFPSKSYYAMRHISHKSGLPFRLPETFKVKENRWRNLIP